MSREWWGVSSEGGGQVNSRVKRFVWGTGGRRKLCMVPSHSCHIYGTCKSKEGGTGGFTVINCDWGKPRSGEAFLWGELTPLDTMLLPA